MNRNFYGRQAEIKSLDELWNSRKAEFLILYGRPRIGKTALLTEWMQRRKHRVLYWQVPLATEDAQLRSFSSAIQGFSKPDLQSSTDFAYHSWSDAWDEIARLTEHERFAVFIDDLQNLIKTMPGSLGSLQSNWDLHLSRSNLFLCLCGPNTFELRRELFSYRYAPLYGRATAHLNLRPFRYLETSIRFDQYSGEDRMALYAIFGGVPAYWNQINPSQPLEAAIRSLLLDAGSPILDEPFQLLQEYLPEPQNYYPLMAAIAKGANTISQIAKVSDLDHSDVVNYIETLVYTGLVRSDRSVTASPASKTEHYEIADHFLRFFFRFLSGQENRLEAGFQDETWLNIRKKLDSFIETGIWREVCQEWLVRAGAVEAIPYLPEQFGSAWNSRTQIELAGIDRTEKTLVLGVCLWSQAPAPARTLARLVYQKAKDLVPRKGEWGVYFIVCAKAGWDEEAQELEIEINRNPVIGMNWKSTGIKLVDLNSIEQDLKMWTNRKSKNKRIKF